MKEEITEDIPLHEAQKKYTLKVLFGPMFGCELNLPADDYFLIINPGQTIQDTTTVPSSAGEHAAYYTQNTLYLPCDKPSPNIILRLTSPTEDEGVTSDFLIEIQDSEGCYTVTLNENEIFTHEHIHFAIKHFDDEWPENIKNFTLTSADNEELSAQETLDSFNKRKRYILIFGFILLIILLLIAAVVWYEQTADEQRLSTLNQALAGAPAHLEIVKGHNNTIYVLATHYQEMEWAKEALIKLHEDDHVVPIWLTQHKKELIEQLAKAGYPVLQLDYTKPQHPVIAVYQVLTAQQETNLKSALLQNIPFALDVAVVVKDKNQLLLDARQGLDRLHIYYRQINTPMGYALVVRDALSDTVLIALQHFIKEFNHQWGSRVVNFSINLDENWLQDKSYLDSPNGYLFLNPRHWYFPLKQGDINRV